MLSPEPVSPPVDDQPENNWVRPGWLIAFLAGSVVVMNIFFFGLSFYMGADLLPEEERPGASPLVRVDDDGKLVRDVHKPEAFPQAKRDVADDAGKPGDTKGE